MHSRDTRARDSDNVASARENNEGESTFQYAHPALRKSNGDGVLVAQVRRRIALLKASSRERARARTLEIRIESRGEGRSINNDETRGSKF